MAAKNKVKEEDEEENCCFRRFSSLNKNLSQELLLGF